MRNGKPTPAYLIANQFPPGVSGNPGGRPRKISDPLETFLKRKVPGDRQSRTYLDKLIQSAVDRAIKRSDTLVQEIFNRIEGKVMQTEDEKAASGMKVVVIDVPRPDRSAMINVTPPRAAVGDNGAHGNGHVPPVDPRPKD